MEVKVAAGQLCSSTRAELIALRAALQRIKDEEERSPVIACSDSRAALEMLSQGAAAQTTPLGADIWDLITSISSHREIILQWIPSHFGIEGNERADALAKEASSLPQEAVTADVRTLTRAVSRAATKSWQDQWPDSFFKQIFGSQLPLPITGDDRDAAVSVHQMRAGHWGRSLQYRHRIGRFPVAACPQCAEKRCPAALCAVCREEADTPEHILLRCPALAGTRLRLSGSIHLDPSQLRDAGVVAALVASYQRHRVPPGHGPQ